MKKKILIFLRRTAYLVIYIIEKVFRVSKPESIVICYHGISQENWNFNISISDFENQINYLKKNFISKGRQNFLITFDDGYEDLYKYRNEITHLGIKPIVFVLSNPEHVNREELDNDKKLLSTNQIKELINLGWEIGLHSATHPDLTTLDNAGLKKEIFDAKGVLERKISRKVNCFAYSKGRYNNEVLKMVEKAGFKMAFSMDDRLITPKTNKFAIPRIGIMKNHNFTEFKSTFLQTSVKFRGFVTRNSHLSLS